MDGITIEIQEVGKPEKIEGKSCWRVFVKYTYEGVPKEHYFFGSKETVESYKAGMKVDW